VDRQINCCRSCPVGGDRERKHGGPEQGSASSG
jgi:hypothetical protein